jgi:hypothetical protein
VGCALIDAIQRAVSGPAAIDAAASSVKQLKSALRSRPSA